MAERIQKLLANAGVGSRREMEAAIDAGRVKVNGEKATLGDQATAHDEITLDGRKVKLELKSVRRVLMYNKPEGEVCSRKDPEGRPSVFDRLPNIQGERWVSIGRLDINTSGLLLFTNDGELANKLMHPSSEVEREYAVRVLGKVDQDMVNRMHEGVELEDGVAKFTDIQQYAGSGANVWYHVVIMEGRNREVRRLWESQGVKVSRLKRVRYGHTFMDSSLRAGTWQEMDAKAVNSLSLSLGMKTKAWSSIVKVKGDRMDRKRESQRTRRSVKKR